MARPLAASEAQAKKRRPAASLSVDARSATKADPAKKADPVGKADPARKPAPPHLLSEAAHPSASHEVGGGLAASASAGAIKTSASRPASADKAAAPQGASSALASDKPEPIAAAIQATLQAPAPASPENPAPQAPELPPALVAAPSAAPPAAPSPPEPALAAGSATEPAFAPAAAMAQHKPGKAADPFGFSAVLQAVTSGTASLPGGDAVASFAAEIDTAKATTQRLLAESGPIASFGETWCQAMAPDPASRAMCQQMLSLWRIQSEATLNFWFSGFGSRGR